MHPVINIALRAARNAAEQIIHVSDRLDRVSIIEDNNGELAMSASGGCSRVCLGSSQRFFAWEKKHLLLLSARRSTGI